MLGNEHDFQFSKMVKDLVEGCSLERFITWRYFYRGAWGDSRNKGGSSAWGPGGNPSQTLHHARRRTAGLQSCPQIQSVSQIHPLSALVDISVKSFIEQSQSSGAKKTDWVGLILCFNSEAVGLHSMGFFLTPVMILRRRLLMYWERWSKYTPKKVEIKETSMKICDSTMHVHWLSNPFIFYSDQNEITRYILPKKLWYFIPRFLLTCLQLLVYTLWHAFLV